MREDACYILTMCKGMESIALHTSSLPFTNSIGNVLNRRPIFEGHHIRKLTLSGAGQYRTDIDSPSFDNLERLIIQNSEYRPRGWHPFPELLPADHPSKKTQDFTKLESFQLVRAFSFSSRSDVIKSLTSSPNLRHLDLVDAFYLHPSQAIYDCPATLERLTLIGSSQLEMLSIWSSYQFKKLERLKRLTVGVLGHESSPFFDMWMLPPNLETLTVMVCECVWEMDEFDTQGLARFVGDQAKADNLGQVQLLEVFVVGNRREKSTDTNHEWVKDNLSAITLREPCAEYSIPLEINYVTCAFLSR